MAEFQEINLNEWELSGEGRGVDRYFKKDDESIMLKLAAPFEGASEMLINEAKEARRVEALAFNTPKVHALVSAEGRYGIIYDRVQEENAIALLCADKPESLEKYARFFAKEVKKIHQTPCDTNEFESYKANALRAVENSKIITKDQRKLFLEFLEELPDETTCLHGNISPASLIVNNDGTPFWINTSSVSYGAPILDLGKPYLFVKVLGFNRRYTNLLQMDALSLMKFWDSFIREYAESEDEEEIHQFEKQCAKACGVALLCNGDDFNFNSKGFMTKIMGKMLFETIINRHIYR